MTPDELRQTVLHLLGQIAPEADFDELDPAESFRDQLDIDSMDFLNFTIALHKRFGVDIPEEEYPLFSTLDRCVSELSKRLGNNP